MSPREGTCRRASIWLALVTDEYGVATQRIRASVEGRLSNRVSRHARASNGSRKPSVRAVDITRRCMNQYTHNPSIVHVARDEIQRLSEDVFASHGMHAGEDVYYGVTVHRHVMRRDSTRSGAQQLEQQASGQSSSTIRKALPYKHRHNASRSQLAPSLANPTTHTRRHNDSG